MSKLTDAELKAMPPKSVRYPEEVALYRDNDFLVAYGLHTDKRIRETGPAHAIGGGDCWDQHGVLQAAFLHRRGLRAQHRLLEVGCGTGRLARKIVTSLAPRNYIGIDISEGALAHALDLAALEGWGGWEPTFLRGDIPLDLEPVDFAWAFSVFNHLPFDTCVEVLRRIATVLKPDGQLLFSYVPAERSWRSGLKQFRHTVEDSGLMCMLAGLTFDDVPDWAESILGDPRPEWVGPQRIACARRKA